MVIELAAMFSQVMGRFRQQPALGAHGRTLDGAGDPQRVFT